MQKVVTTFSLPNQNGDHNTFVARLDPDLESKVNAILNRMPTPLKETVIQNHRQEQPQQQPRTSLREILQTGPFNRSTTSQFDSATKQLNPLLQSYNRSQTSPKKYNDNNATDRKVLEQPLAVSYRPNYHSLSEKKASTGTPSKDNLAPLRAYQEVLNRRVEDTLRKSQTIARSPRQQSPKRIQHAYTPSYGHTPNRALNFDNDRLNNRIEEALSRSGTKYKKSGYRSPLRETGFLSPQARHVQRYYENNYGLNDKDKGLPINSLIKTFAERAMTDKLYNDGLKKSQTLFQKDSAKKEPASVYASRFLDSAHKSSGNTARSHFGSPRGLSSKSPTRLREVLINAHILDQKPQLVEEHYNDGTAYTGDLLGGKRSGRGVFVYVDGSKYDGEWHDSERHGYGTQTDPSGRVIYEGEWVRGKYHGKGSVYNPTPTKLKGEFDFKNFSDLRNYWEKYEGEFDLGKWCGFGTVFLANGERFVGKFRYGKVHGTGTHYQLGDKDVTGEWKEDKFVASL